MRRLKLQMQVTVDGFIAGPNGELDWMQFDMDMKLLDFINELTDSSDIILMGRKMTPGFISYWEHVVNNQPESPEFAFAKKMVDKPKIAFSKTLTSMEGKNLTVENGDLVEAVNKLKSQPGKDIIVYGGANFASSLISNNLIDDYYLFTNPVAIGEGLRIFHGRKKLKLVNATAYNSEVVTHWINA